MSEESREAAAGRSLKVQKAMQGGSRLRRYGDLVVGSGRLRDILVYELLTGLLGGMPGMAGLFLRAKLYPLLFGGFGTGSLIGRNVTIRHPRRIVLGKDVVVDDNATLDAKGFSNRGITLGEGVYVGRNSILYCKDGDITLEEKVNISHNCQLFSAGRLQIGAGTLVAGFAYIMSGGEYDIEGGTPLVEQEAGRPARATFVGRNCWIGGHAVLMDGTSVGDGTVIGAGAVVKGDLPGGVVAVGVPARPVRQIRR